MALNRDQLAVVSMVRNEADIIEAFVRHHCRWVGRMMIVLHRPRTRSLITDNTEEILRSLAAEGLPVEIRVFEEHHYAQRTVITNAVRELSREDHIEWVMPLDADEFLVPRGGLDLADVLVDCETTTAHQVSWRTYVPTENDDPSEVNPSRRIQHRRVREPERTPKVIVPAGLGGHPKCRISQGSHRLKIGKTPLNAPSEEISIAHFPIRSIRQIRTKVFNGWLQDLAATKKTDGPNLHWGRLYDLLSDSQDDGLCLQELALDYRFSCHPDTDRSLILDPIPSIADDLRYEARPINPWQVLAASAEELARALGERKRNPFFAWR